MEKMTAKEAMQRMIDCYKQRTEVIPRKKLVGLDINDYLCCDTIDCTNPLTPQIPLSECDILVMADLAGGAIVYKDGLCGIYDITKAENVTRIEYPWLSAGSREEYEGGNYTFFIVVYPENHGVLGVSEQTNEYICILYPYNEEEDKE